MQAAAAASHGPSHQEVSAEVQSVVAALVGRSVGPEEPLMEAGLDSLGESISHCTEALQEIDNEIQVAGWLQH